MLDAPTAFGISSHTKRAGSPFLVLRLKPGHLGNSGNDGFSLQLVEWPSTTFANPFDTFDFHGQPIRWLPMSCARSREQLPVRSAFVLPRLLICGANVQI